MFFNGSGGGGGGAYGIILKEIKYTGRAVSALLNSSVSDFVIRHTSSQFQGGYYAYNQQYIEKLPVPISSVADLSRLMDGLSSLGIETVGSVSEVLDQLVRKFGKRTNRPEESQPLPAGSPRQL
jgi:hypothetical protein